jgi:hypothetical protein
MIKTWHDFTRGDGAAFCYGLEVAPVNASVQTDRGILCRLVSSLEQGPPDDSMWQDRARAWYVVIAVVSSLNIRKTS